MNWVEPKENFLRKLFLRELRSQAFIITGDEDERVKGIDLLTKFLTCEKKEICKKCKYCLVKTSPDLYVYEDTSLAMDDAKEIRSRASQSGFNGTKIFVLKNRFFPLESQTALLKTIEEPTTDTFFIISTASKEGLLPAFLSRVTALNTAWSKTENNSASFKKINAGGIKKQLEAVSILSKEREKAETFLNAMEFWAESKLKEATENNAKIFITFLEDLLQTKKRFYMKTYYNRMLLEHMLISKTYLD
jgi:DNA polymerase III delta prime subunit